MYVFKRLQEGVLELGSAEMHQLGFIICWNVFYFVSHFIFSFCTSKVNEGSNYDRVCLNRWYEIPYYLRLIAEGKQARVVTPIYCKNLTSMRL